MKIRVIATLVLLCTSTVIASGEAASRADDETMEAASKVIRQYLALPHPEKDHLGKARIKRLDTLRQLRHLPQSLVPAIKAALDETTRVEQRVELVEVLRNFPSEQSASVLIDLLDDPEARVRQEAVQRLRLMARRVNRFGNDRKQRGEMFLPKVEGLVPHLIAAANDEDERVRVSAVYALADTRDPAAVDELRRRLEDARPRVRLKAACLLTEFKDNSGLAEMKQALKRLRDEEDALRYFDLGMLLASFERITGKSFGPIPSNPFILSHTRQIEEAKRRYDLLADAWWNWVESEQE